MTLEGMTPEQRARRSEGRHMGHGGSDPRHPAKRKHAPIMRPTDERVGRSCRVVQATSQRGDVFANAYGVVVEVGADPALVLVRTDKGSCWSKVVDWVRAS